MAFLRSGTIGNGSPKMYYEIYADNINATANSKTVRVTLKAKVNGTSASRFGYAVQWRASIQTPYEFANSGWSYLKNSEMWNGGEGLRTFVADVTFDGRQPGGIACLPGFEIYSSGSSWNGSAYSQTNFGTLSSNTAPYWASGASITTRQNSASGKIISSASGGTENSIKIPENVSAIHCSWSNALDNEGGTITYKLYAQQNDGAWNVIYTGTSTSYLHQIGSGSEGTSFDYYVIATDSGGMSSGDCNALQFQKNTMTGATLNSNSFIDFETENIEFTYSGASNTDGNSTFTYKLSCSEVEVFNPTIKTSPVTLTIYKSGAVPTTPYIKLSDIADKLSALSFKGNLNFVLTTTNAYGTNKTNIKTVAVDIRTNPEPVNCSISKDKTISTAIKVTADTKGEYFIPNGTDKISISWNGGLCKLGSITTYDLQVKFGNGSFTTIASNLASSVQSYDYICPTQTVSQILTFRVVAKTSYGYTSYKDSSGITLHYYNTPAITVGNITRTDTTALIPITVKTNSSIPNINTKGSWYNRATGTTTNLQTGTLTQVQTVQNISLNALISGGTYTLTIVYNDGTGFTSDATRTIAIGANLPVFHVNKYGVGVGGGSASSNCALSVVGNANFYNDMSCNGNLTFASNKGLVAGGNTYLRSNGTATVLSANEDMMHFRPNGNTSEINSMKLDKNGQLILSSNAVTGNGITYNAPNGKWFKINQPNDNYTWLDSNANTGFHMTKNLYVKGDIYAGSSYNQKVYHTGNKPTPADIGASASNHTHDNVASSTVTKGFNIPTAPRVSNLNTLTTCGFFAFSTGCTSAPCDYGLVLNLIWGTDNSAQAVWSVTSQSMYIRYKNKTWSAWRVW